MWIIYERDTGIIAWIGGRYPDNVVMGDRGMVIPIPDQPLTVADPENGIPGDIVLGKSKYPDAIPLRYTAAEIAIINGKIIDRDTGKAINQEIHPFAGLEEQIAILRDQLVHILNDLGMEPTADFARLNEIAVAAVEAAAKKKGKHAASKATRLQKVTADTRVARAKLAKMKKHGERVEMSLDELRETVMYLLDHSGHDN